jgi:hypothetical protein
VSGGPYERRGDAVVPASDEDRRVADAYADAREKGPETDGYRLTVLTARSTVHVGEPVRVVHVCESTSPDAPLYVMGPKAVHHELVDGEPVTDPPPDGEHPLAPARYNGRVLPGPGVDTNYVVTEHRFDAPGEHTVQWAPGPFRSNVLRVEVS